NNVVEGFWCPSGLSEHGIHFWTGSRGTLVERNLLKNNARGIGFGLGDGSFGLGRTYGDQPCPGVGAASHYLGVIRNNFISVSRDRVFDSAAGFDTGIGLEQACGAELAHNSVAATRPAGSSSIEWRFTLSNPVVLNNLVTQTLRARDGAVAANTRGNLE